MLGICNRNITYIGFSKDFVKSSPRYLLGLTVLIVLYAYTRLKTGPFKAYIETTGT
jgi:hypothetical protein